MVREIELERLFSDDCDLVEGPSDGCEEFETGPFLLELPLDGTVDQVFSIDVPPDTYDELEFDIPVLHEGDVYARYMIRLEESEGMGGRAVRVGFGALLSACAAPPG